MLKVGTKAKFYDQTSASCLQQTVAIPILIINTGNNNNLNKFWVGIFTRRVTASKFTKRYGVSELVSDKHSQWSDSGTIIKIKEFIYAFPLKLPDSRQTFQANAGGTKFVPL